MNSAPLYMDSKERFWRKFAALPEDTVEEYCGICKSAIQFGNDLVYNTVVSRCKADDPISEKDMKILYEESMRARFRWINTLNKRILFNWTCYGLMHDGWNFK